MANLTLTQQDIDEIAIAFERNGAENNREIREALDKVLADLTALTIPKVYRATLTQTFTSAPVATIHENSLSDVPVWSYDTVGDYDLTLASEWADNKTFILIGNTAISGGGCAYLRTDGNVIQFVTTNAAGTLTDGILSQTAVLILVYP